MELLRATAESRESRPKTDRRSARAADLALAIVGVFIAYFIAGKLGQATTAIRSSNLGPVWPAYGIALAAFLAFGARVWPGILFSAFVVALSSSVHPLTAAGQAAGATLASLTGAQVLRSRFHFDPLLSRLRDALALVILGAFGSAVISASIGVSSLYATGVTPYSGLASSWLVYWLGDSTGVLLVTPLVFTISTLFTIRRRDEILRLISLVVLLTVACFIVFVDLPLIPDRPHVFAFAILPFVMWAAIDFGVAGASLSVFLIATIATLATAFGLGPFAGTTSFVAAVLLDVLFTVLALTGLALAAVIAEREHARSEREQLIRAQTAMEARLHLAAIVESSNDAIFSKDLDNIILSWNAAAERIFGFTRSEAVGRSAAIIVPPERRDEEVALLQRLKNGERIARFKSVRVTKTGNRIDVALTLSPLTDSAGTLVGAAEIARDITEQERIARALSTVRGRLLHAQEQERARISRELHDDIGQRVALLAVGLTELSSGTGAERSRSLQKLASDIAIDIHTLSHELHTSKLELLGMLGAMKSFCREFSEQQHARVEFSSDGIPSHLPEPISLCFFRVLQEALHNALKHSGVRDFEVRMWKTDDEVHLVVSDSGVGFDLAAARAGRGLGLVSMEERLRLVDGDLRIETTPRRGTTIHAHAPLPAD